jgi:hypothetical protein
MNNIPEKRIHRIKFLWLREIKRGRIEWTRYYSQRLKFVTENYENNTKRTNAPVHKKDVAGI